MLKLQKVTIAFILLLFGYLFLHLLGLLELPVFADEAIYIRWSQLIIDDLPRYLFFSMNDGKTPLFFWILAPFQFIFEDQLYAARFVSILIGLCQMISVMSIVRILTKNRKTMLLSGFLVATLPFWYFHHRMALTDGLMVLMISVSMLFLIKELVTQKKVEQIALSSILQIFSNKRTRKHIILAGIFFGLALLSKIPAVLFIPNLFLFIFFVRHRNTSSLILAATKVVVVLFLGVLVFFSLRFAPSFTQLFSRGSDFLFPVSEVLAGRWRETVISFPVYFGYFFSYMTPSLILLIVCGLFAKRNKILVHVFFWSGILFIIPVGLLGKMVYPRYLFPAVLPFTLASVFAIEDLFVWGKKFGNNLLVQSSYLTFLVLLIANTISGSLIFIYYSITDHTMIPFVTSDRVQYLTEWSSGHGIFEISQLIKSTAQDKTIAVATEGSFGTLPDGLNLYFHRRDVSNISIDGVGYPVFGISEKFAQSARNYERKWLVINSHRNNLNLDQKFLLDEFCRPFASSCLQLWDITDIFENLVTK